MISYDEAVFSGFYYGIPSASSTNTYLKNTSYPSTITMSPSNASSSTTSNKIWQIATYTLNAELNSTTGPVRPVINLKADVTISNGNGSSGTPYVIS